MAGKFVITKDREGEFRFALKSGNGETIAVSEGYSTKTNLLEGVESVRRPVSEHGPHRGPGTAR